MKKEQRGLKEQEKLNELPSLKGIKGSDINPFMIELKGKMFLQPRANTIIAKGQEIIDTTTGEVLRDDVLLGRRKVVDKSQFAKIYASEIAVLFDLSKAALNVFLYLTKIMDYEQKAIFDYMKEYGKVGYKSHKQCLFGLRELISHDIVYPHVVSGIWWLNPTLVCKGERFAKYTEYVTEERHQKDLQNAMMHKQNNERLTMLDNQTIGKIEAMNRAEESKYYKELEENEGLSPLIPFDE